MNFSAPGSDEMAEMYQLNGLFLRLIQQAAESGQTALGFPEDLLGQLATLDQGQLQRIAAVPRCLFALSVARDQNSPLTPAPPTVWESARRSFALAALYAAWTSVRRSSAVARALYGLPLEPLRRLRILGIADLVRQATDPHVVCCSFAAVPGVWHALIDSPSQPLPRALVLTLIAAGRGIPAAPTPTVAAVLAS